MTEQKYKIHEEWFYLIMIAIEGYSAKLLPKFLHLSDLIRNDNYDEVLSIMKEFNGIMDKNVKTVARMTEKCDPDVFYNKIRFHLSGYSDRYFSKGGLTLEGKDEILLTYKGGSAAQSTLIQTYDIVLGTKLTHGVEFLREMRDYMPAKHKQYLKHLEKQEFNLCDFVNIYKDDDDVVFYYNSLIDNFMKFRQIHIKLVHRYIVQENQKRPSIHGAVGTGMTDLMNFLAPFIKQTGDARIKIVKKSKFLFTISIILILFALNYNHKFIQFDNNYMLILSMIWLFYMLSIY